MRVALVNSVILNGGDAGIVYGTCDAIESELPQARVTVFSRFTEQARHHFVDLSLTEMPHDTWPKQRFLSSAMRRSFPCRSKIGMLSISEKEFYEHLRKMDVIVSCGGGYINDQYSTGVLFRIMKDTLDLKIPHMAYAHSLGPFFKEKTVRAVNRILSRFDAVTVRDQHSLEQLRDIKVTSKKMEFTADAAFSMRISADGKEFSESDQAELDNILEFKDRGSGKGLLFMSVRQWHFPGFRNGQILFDRYKIELVKFVDKILRDTDWRICFISTCQGRIGYSLDDAEFAASLIKELTDSVIDRIYLCRHAFMPRSYPLIIKKCADIVLSMRMHFMIFSIMAGIPCVALAYERKSYELACQVGIEDLCHELRELKWEDLWKSFIKAEEKASDFRIKIRKAHQSLYRSSMRNAKILHEVIAPG